jgi:2-hydroxycyclohexanecarboxyl-CoA dehydrogenase
MDLGLDGARVIVTGGASNIGRAIVHAFATEQARVLICDVDEAQAEKVRAEALELGAAGADTFIADLTEPDAPARAVDTCVDAWGGLDVLVNNAGWTVHRFLSQHTDQDEWRRIVDINLFAAIAGTQAAASAMKHAGGSIVYISSDAATGEFRQAVYGAAKAGLLALCRSTAKEHGRDGIRANVVSPGLVLPDGDDAVGEKSLWAVGTQMLFNDDQRDYMLKATPLRRLTTADDVAQAVLWISSPTAARQVTGQMFSVSGGYSMP